MDLNQYLLCDVFDAYLYDSNDNLILVQENLTGSDVVGKADSLDVKNGRGGGIFAKLLYNKQVDITLKTNTFNFSTLALLCGTSVGTGNSTSYSAPQSLTVATKVITLGDTPKDSTKVEIYDKDNAKIISTAYAIVDKVVTFTASTYDTTEVRVMPYEYDCSGDSIKEIVVDADKFPSACKLILKGIEKDSNTAEFAELTIICEKAQPSTDFSLSTSSEVKPVETEIKLSVQTRVGSKRLLTIQEKAIV